ncbi:MAG TPA: hypothetical protein VHB02_17235 [Acidimicrobiales bacterium]|nr:hypothetical protein [Acidimicrobiales bacterium]
MAGQRVGGIDDPVWLAPPDPAVPARRGPWRNVGAVTAVVGLPAIAVLSHGFDWVSMAAGVGAATVVLAILYRRPAGAALAGLVLLAAAFAGLELDNGLTYHTLSLDGPPAHAIHWCGRDYDDNPPSDRPPSPPDSPAAGPPQLVTITPSGAAVYSDVACRNGLLPGVLYAQAGPGRWVYYSLSGGP